ncbi:IclR family transcriptional regulator [Defluviimonas sp. 20V17]|uniref:IclR family transcriptional regulator n=1 Tax=Allgaiera indica TaxID=765699 RepID=A0AAN4UT32_9RHOB|nr:HTH-type transcriptional regulator BhcR [Allgaiera indica]KDB02123.1 IclR family transcriptional regulator [Defluviimonas sp. 20V17]GHE02948.1 IclR family transcriptional regulator [Allgaiera indica]SDX14060.1 transcriptional regulator, IclR family [Allgaiera indica]
MKSQANASGGGRRARGRPRGWDDKTAQNTIKSLDRAMEVFEYLSEAQGKPLTMLADEMGQSPATVYRILVTLEGHRLVEFDHEEQVWHIGTGAFVIGARYLRRTSLVDRARPIMRKLMEATGETANLGIEREAAVLFLSQVETHANIRAFFPPGTLSPMHASGIGKALLAHMDEDRLDRLLARTDLQAFTEHSITDRSALKEDLKTIRARGFSVDNEEKNLGMRCIAAPVFDMNKEAVAGISVSGPTHRVDEAEIERLSSAVIGAAHQLTLAIGGGATEPRS